MTTLGFIDESNRIEGITRAPTLAEIEEHNRFMALDKITINDLSRFVECYQPGAKLRSQPGMDVVVGQRFPPLGGETVILGFNELLHRVNERAIKPWAAHVEYEHLHPFMDGNGRSGRVLWYWMMLRDGNPLTKLGFLHAFYYQTLKGVEIGR